MTAARVGAASDDVRIEVYKLVDGLLLTLNWWLNVSAEVVGIVWFSSDQAYEALQFHEPSYWLIIDWVNIFHTKSVRN
jgi:hypothetical protein